MPFFAFPMKVWDLNCTKTKYRLLPFRMVTSKSLWLNQSASRAICNFCTSKILNCLTTHYLLYPPWGVGPLLTLDFLEFLETLFGERKNITERKRLLKLVKCDFFKGRSNWGGGRTPMSRRETWLDSWKFSKAVSAQCKTGLLFNQIWGSVNKNTPIAKVKMPPKHVMELLSQSEERHYNAHLFAKVYWLL